MRPILAIVGARSRVDEVRTFLTGLKLECPIVSWRDLDTLDDENDGASYLLTSRPPDEPLPLAVSRLHRAHPESAIFVSVPELDDEGVREMYLAGASAVFVWPDEAGALDQLLAELLGTRLVSGEAARANERLERAVNAHLKLLDHNVSGLRVDVDGPVVRLRGEIDALWRIDDLREAIEAVPGVEHVSTRGIHVEPRRRADDRIHADLQRIIDHVTDDDDRVTITVSRGFVTLSGHVQAREKKSRLAARVKYIDGVRGLRDAVAAPLESA